MLANQILSYWLLGMEMQFYSDLQYDDFFRLAF